jgi:RHS repeat-associated protein
LTLAGTAYERLGSQENRFKFNGGNEFQEDLGIDWYSTIHRNYDPILGRFWSIDNLADMFPSVNPMIFGYNNPIVFNDPMGLSAQEGGDDDKVYDGRMLDEVVITAPKANKNRSKYYRLLNSSNPIERNIHRAYIKYGANGAYDLINRGRKIRYGEGLGYETDFSKGLNKMMEGVSLGIGGTMLLMYASPVLLENVGNLTQIGVSGIKTQIGLNMATELGFQVGTNAITGQNPLSIDFADVAISAFPVSRIMRPIASGMVDLNFSQSNILQIGFIDKPLSATITDLSIGIGTNQLGRVLRKSNIDKNVITAIEYYNNAKGKAIGGLIKSGIKDGKNQ